MMQTLTVVFRDFNHTGVICWENIHQIDTSLHIYCYNLKLRVFGFQSVFGTKI